MTQGIGSTAGTAQRSALALLLALGLLLAFGATVANAGTVSASVTVQGSGQVIAPISGFSCDRRANLDDRVSLPCGTATQSLFGVVVPMVLHAVPQPTPAGHWVTGGWQGCDSGDGTAVCTIVDTSQFGTRPTVNVKAVFDDIEAPTVTPGVPIFSTTTDRTVRFGISTNEPSSLTCSIDGSATFTPCSAGTYFTLAEGPHSIRVRAVDRSGNTRTSASVPFSIVDTKLVSGPPNFSASTNASFKFSTLAGFSFDCSLDSVVLADCGTKLADGTLTKSFTGLAQGVHTFRVRARNGTDLDHVPIVRTWTVDTVAPNTSVAAANLPEGIVTTLLGATFTFASSEPLGQLQCKLDGAAFAACTSPRAFADLPFGTRNFQVRAVDRAGNVDASPASRTWTIAAKDDDGDGFNQRTDCNDAAITINPARPEILDNDVDENCDGVKGINLDRDGDGAQRPGDCNDTDANVRPGAAEIPGNGVDDDCRGGDAIEVLDPDLVHSSRTFARFTKLTKLQVKLPGNRGATIKVTCKVGKKKKCPGKAKKKFTKRNAGKLTNLKKRFVGVRLKPKTVITVTVSKANAIGSVKTLTVRKGKVPLVRTKCTAVGGTKAVAC